jgi:hypothetical protein
VDLVITDREMPELNGTRLQRLLEDQAYSPGPLDYGIL